MNKEQKIKFLNKIVKLMYFNYKINFNIRVVLNFTCFINYHGMLYFWLSKEQPEAETIEY